MTATSIRSYITPFRSVSSPSPTCTSNISRTTERILNIQTVVHVECFNEVSFRRMFFVVFSPVTRCTPQTASNFFYSSFDRAWQLHLFDFETMVSFQNIILKSYKDLYGEKRFGYRVRIHMIWRFIQLDFDLHQDLQYICLSLKWSVITRPQFARTNAPKKQKSNPHLLTISSRANLPRIYYCEGRYHQRQSRDVPRKILPVAVVLQKLRSLNETRKSKSLHSVTT